MDVANGPSDPRRRAQRGIWTSGRVAKLLGISPVTLRSWDTRYGVGPSTRAEGRQRRYSDVDVARLQRMRELIGRGVQAREAAQVVLSDQAGPASGAGPGDCVRELSNAVEDVRYVSIAALLDESFAVRGAARTWSDVVAPVLRSLGERWARGDECYASEWALASEVSAAIDRYVRPRPPVVTSGPVLLACCSGERHSLPLEILRAVLAEARIPAVLLGGMVPAETALAAVAKLEPSAVVLWSMTADTADTRLRDRLRQGASRLCLAGNGWKHLSDTGIPHVDDLVAAIALVGDLALT